MIKGVCVSHGACILQFTACSLVTVAQCVVGDYTWPLAQVREEERGWSLEMVGGSSGQQSPGAVW